MDNVVLVKSNTLYSGAEKVISLIKPNCGDFSSDNIVIVPDRFSLIAEKLIFKQLNISSTVNINVMGINKLAKKLIDTAGLDCVLCDTKQSILLIRRVMQKLNKQFLCFGKNISYNLCEQIQKTISQLQSSGISCSQIQSAPNISDENLKNKIHDLSLIMQEYENLLNGRLDASTLLKVFSNLIAKTSEYKNTNFYFVGFDSFTNQGYEILENLINNSKSVNVACLFGKNQNNKNIYDNEIYEKLVKICQKCKKNPKIIENLTNYGIEVEHLINNLYAYNPIKINNKNTYASIISSNSVYEEIKFVAKSIVNQTKNFDMKYLNFSVCAPQSYFTYIENEFNQLGISYYIDTSTKLYNCNLAQFILTFFDMIETYFNTGSLIKFIYSDFVILGEKEKNEIENYIKQNAIYGKEILSIKEIYGTEIFEKIYKLHSKIKNEDLCSNYINIITEFLDIFNVENILESISLNFHKNNNIKLEKLHLQIYDKTKQIITKIEQLLGDEKIRFEEFNDLICCAFKQEEINSVPCSIDSVYVGDSSVSFFEKCDNLYIMGANEDSLPIVMADTGLIGDDEIYSLKQHMDINPTIKIINKRNKFKLFELSTIANKLYVSYVNLTPEGKNRNPSSLVVGIKKCLNNIEEINTVFENVYYDENEEQNFNKLKNNCISGYQAKLNIYQNPKYSPLIKKSLALNNIEFFYKKCEKNTINDAKTVFFAKNYTKVSQIEKYFACPFSHYLTYGLKLKTPKTVVLQPNDYGNVLHRVSEIFVKKNCDNLSNMDKTDIEKSVDEIFESLIKTEFFMLNKKENKFSKIILKDESIRFCNFVCEEQSHSKFKPNKKTLEMRFGFNENDKKPLKIDIDGQQYKIVGAVDRVDIHGNYFRIIDYKTGSLGADSAKYNALMYGNKIQIFVYLEATKNILGKNAFGVFYLPITNSFKKQDEDKYKLKGFLINNSEQVFACDDEISYENPKSRFIEAELSCSAKNLKENKQVIIGNKVVSNDILENMTKYSLKITEQAIKEILSGYITPSPFKGSCSYCPYSSICGFSESINNERKPAEKITKKNFEGEV